jgi:hypothetical protein
MFRWMEDMCSSETSVLPTRTTPRHIPEENTLQYCRREKHPRRQRSSLIHVVFPVLVMPNDAQSPETQWFQCYVVFPQDEHDIFYKYLIKQMRPLLFVESSEMILKYYCTFCFLPWGQRGRKTSVFVNETYFSFWVCHEFINGYKF